MRPDRVGLQRNNWSAGDGALAGQSDAVQRCLGQAWSGREKVNHQEDQEEGAKLSGVHERSSPAFLLGALGGEYPIGKCSLVSVAVRRRLRRAWSGREEVNHQEDQEEGGAKLSGVHERSSAAVLLGALGGEFLMGKRQTASDKQRNFRTIEQKFFAFFQKGSACLLACAALAFVTHSAKAADAALKVCVDSASPTQAHDRQVAASVAQQAGLALSVVPFDSGDDDDGVPAKAFRKLLTHGCDLVMGYPVDVTASDLPEGLLATKPYAQTGFVLVTAPGETAHRLADLPAGTEVAVTYDAPPNLYFVDHPNVSADIQTTDPDTLKAVMDGHDRAAMVWQPTVDAYLASHAGAAKPGVYTLDEPHARFNVVALYLPSEARAAETFNATKISMDVSGKPEPAGALPALYTAAQAKTGYAKFIGSCAMCHGVNLQGKAGPGLKGPNWANAKADYTVGEVFTVVSQQMPATDPGSLAQDDYVDIMAFLLQQNGYPAGNKALEFTAAASSDVKLLYHGK